MKNVKHLGRCTLIVKKGSGFAETTNEFMKLKLFSKTVEVPNVKCKNFSMPLQFAWKLFHLNYFPKWSASN